MNVLRVLPRFRWAEAEIEKHAQRTRWSREQIEAHQLSKLNKLWLNSIQFVPYYRDLFLERALPKRFESLAEFRKTVPLLPKLAVRENPERFLAPNRAKGSYRKTSGSTGSPMRFYWSNDEHLEVLRCRDCFYSQWGVGPLDRTAFVWSSKAGDSSKLTDLKDSAIETLIDRMRGRLRFVAYNLESARLRHFLRQLASFRPTMLYGFSRAIYLLALEARDIGFLCDSLKVVVLTSEVASPEMIETIEESFGVPAVMEYGATECNLIAGEARDGTLRVREDIVFLESLPREDGLCDLVLTVLVNHSNPLIRYAIADVTDEPVRYPDQGFAILPKVGGRQDDVAYSSDGGVLHPARFDSVFISMHEQVRRYQVRQKEDGAALVSLELTEDASLPQVEPLLSKELRKLFGGFPVRFKATNKIVQTSAGKHKVIRSDFVQETERRFS